MRTGSAAEDLALRLGELGIACRLNAPMSEYTTLRLGGPADVLCEPADEAQLARVLEEIRLRELPLTVIGRGSNLLVLDGGIPGAVLRLGRGEKEPAVLGSSLRAWGGTTLAALAAAAAGAGLKGLVFASGIPGTVGGGVTMNAGAYGGELSDTVVRVRGLRANGSYFHYDRDEMDFGYRHSRLQQEPGSIVTEVTFALTPGDPEQLRAEAAELNRRRAEKQPLTERSAGSTFKRPEGYYAAALIEECGLKGFAVGGAMVSEKHAGFLISRGGTAREYLALVRQVRQIVWEQKGVHLEPEIRILGREEEA